MPIVPVKPPVTNPPPRRRSPLAQPMREDEFDTASSAGSARSSSPGPREYKVGYGKPPKHSRFKPGQSGNPKGRRKGAKAFNTIIKEALLKPVVVRTSNGSKKITSAEALVLRALESGTKGDFRAIEKLLTWYQGAVPLTSSANPAQVAAPETLSTTDEATMAELRRMILGEADDSEEEEERP